MPIAHDATAIPQSALRNAGRLRRGAADGAAACSAGTAGPSPRSSRDPAPPATRSVVPPASTVSPGESGTGSAPIGSPLTMVPFALARSVTRSPVGPAASKRQWLRDSSPSGTWMSQVDERPSLSPPGPTSNLRPASGPFTASSDGFSAIRTLLS